jgi:transposase InsO family protein
VAAVIDLFSRRVVGWSMRAIMAAELVIDALLMAIWRRRRPDALLHQFRPGVPIPQRTVPGVHGGARDTMQHEPVRQRLGQRRDG